MILQGQRYPDTKAGSGYHNKRKPQANIPDEYSCKNSEHGTSKLNSRMY